MDQGEEIEKERMKKRSLIITIYIVTSLLLVIGNFTKVMANPGRIEDASFEAVTNWAWDATDGDYDPGTQSTTGVTQGTYSYNKSAPKATRRI